MKHRKIVAEISIDFIGISETAPQISDTIDERPL